MHVLLIQLSLYIPQSHSLKEKRREIKSLKDKLSARFNLSVAEVGELENWQQADIAICMVSNERSYLDKQFSAIELLLQDYSELQVMSIVRQWL